MQMNSKVKLNGVKGVIVDILPEELPLIKVKFEDQEEPQLVRITDLEEDE